MTLFGLKSRFILTALTVLAGCSKPDAGTPQAAEEGVPKAAAAAGVLTVQAGRGTSTTLKTVDHTRIVSLGGAVTDSLFRLGVGARIVARDATSVEPSGKVDTIPKLGLFRAVAAEGVIAQKPSVVIAIEGSGPASALEQIRHAGIDVVMVDDASTPEAAASRLEALGALVGAPERGKTLAHILRKDVTEVIQKTGDQASKPTVLFIYARGRKTLLVAGNATPATAMITLAGGQTAVKAYDGFRPLTAEGVIAAAPDVILATRGGLASLGGIDGFLSLPGIAQTPAGKARRIVAIHDLELLGFGATMGSALRTLAQAIHPAAFTDTSL